MTSSSPRQAAVIEVDGRLVDTEVGLSVAAALLRAGILQLRTSPTGLPRGAFCMMGVCQECLVEIDGVQRQACLVAVEPGVRVLTGRHQ